MPNPGDYVLEQAKTGGAGPHIVRLLVADPTMPTAGAFVAAVGRGCGRVELMDPSGGGLSFALLDHRIDFKDRRGVPAMHLIALSEGLGDTRDLEAALEQTFDWPYARDALSRARGLILVTDMAAGGLDRHKRLAVLTHTVRVLASLTSTVAIHWMPSQRLVDPAALAAADLRHGPLFPAAVSVRMFRILGREPGETVMDTLGMASYGLPDLQCHFAGLEPDDVASRLYAFAEYLFEKGDVIKDGQTVEGVGGEKWRCQHEDSLIAPTRALLDLHPGWARPEKRG